MPDTVIHYFSFVISNFQENLVLSVSALLQQYGGELNEGSDDHICGGDNGGKGLQNSLEASAVLVGVVSEKSQGEEVW